MSINWNIFVDRDWMNELRYDKDQNQKVGLNVNMCQNDSICLEKGTWKAAKECLILKWIAFEGQYLKTVQVQNEQRSFVQCNCQNWLWCNIPK